jgi:hypothetical protein
MKLSSSLSCCGENIGYNGRLPVLDAPYPKSIVSLVSNDHTCSMEGQRIPSMLFDLEQYVQKCAAYLWVSGPPDDHYGDRPKNLPFLESMHPRGCRHL